MAKQAKSSVQILLIEFSYLLWPDDRWTGNMWPFCVQNRAPILGIVVFWEPFWAWVGMKCVMVLCVQFFGLELVPLVLVWMETQLNEGWLSVLTGFIGPGWVRTARPMAGSGPVFEISGSWNEAGSAETSGGPPKQYCSAEHGSPCITPEDTIF